jgi:hypothetical protein
MKYLFILLLSILASCGSTVAVDFDNQTNFTEFSSYNFYPNIDSGLNDLDDKRIMIAIDSLMAQKGFRKAESPQLLVNFFVKEFLTNSRNTLGIGVGGGGGNMGIGVSGGIPIGGKEIEQQFTLDLIDTNNDALVWQGILNGRYKEKSSPLQKEKYYGGILQKILKKYPPASK